MTFDRKDEMGAISAPYFDAEYPSMVQEILSSPSKAEH